MHNEILTKEQLKLLSLVESFSKNFGLVGGTAIALHMGHRYSVDFDLFTFEEFDNAKIKRKIVKTQRIDKILSDEKGQFTFFINGVMFTFFQYPFKIKFSKNFDDVIKVPNLLTLAAMKAYALGRRAKWKDYVDLYFIIKMYSVDQVIKKAKQIFGNDFNEKLFRTQLAYFKDINYSEEVVYVKGCEVKDGVVKRALVEFSLS